MRRKHSNDDETGWKSIDGMNVLVDDLGWTELDLIGDV